MPLIPVDLGPPIDDDLPLLADASAYAALPTAHPHDASACAACEHWKAITLRRPRRSRSGDTFYAFRFGPPGDVWRAYPEHHRALIAHRAAVQRARRDAGA